MPTYTASEPVEGGAAPLEDGPYQVTVEDAGEETAKSGNEMIKLTLAINGRNNKLFERLVFTENAFWKIDGVRAALGFKVTAGETLEIKADDFIGKTGIVHVSHEEYKGRQVPKILAWEFDPDRIEAAKEEIENRDGPIDSAASSPAEEDDDCPNF